MSEKKMRRVVGSENKNTESMLKSDASRTKKKQEKLQGLNRKAFSIKAMDDADDDDPYKAKGDGYENYPTSALLKGKWIARDPRDTRMKNLSRLVSSGQLGSVQAPTEEALSWVEDKQNQIYQQNKYRLASALIDNQHPETQERAYQIMPALKKIPESHVLDETAMQMTLNSILRDGVLKGPEDLDFIMYILSPDVVLPTEPLWDLSGAFKNVRKEIADKENLKQKTGIFSPFKYGYDTTKFDDDLTKGQMKMKSAIVKRLFPAFRNKDYEEIEEFISDIAFKSDSTDLYEKIGYDANTSKSMTGKFDPYGKMLKK